MLTFTIPGELTTLNEYIDAERRHYHLAAALKKKETKRVAMEIKALGIKPLTIFPVHIIYIWYSKDARKDLDNVAFSKKFIQDGLVLGGLIPNDSRKQIAGFSDIFYIDKENPRTEVNIVRLTEAEKLKIISKH
jgi:hypothetical protein